MPDRPELLSDEWFHALTVDDREFSTQDGCKRILREAVAEALEWFIRAKANEFRNATL